MYLYTCLPPEQKERLLKDYPLIGRKEIEAAKKDHAKALEGAAAYVLAAWKGGELLMGLDRAHTNLRSATGHDDRQQNSTF